MERGQIHAHGLGPEQQQVAAELYAGVLETSLALRGTESAVVRRWTTETIAHGGITGPVVSNREFIGDLWRSFRARIALRRAAGHYAANAGAYQEQALLDATEAGFAIDGWGVD